ncbi:hypothetical protein J2809_002038 [Arthrobacter pascens]|nr:hypothetical protein [Arthrobacter pascens]
MVEASAGGRELTTAWGVVLVPPAVSAPSPTIITEESEVSL